MDKKSIFLALFIFIIIVLAFYFAFEDNSIINDFSPVENDEQAEEELKEVRFSIFNDREKQRLEVVSERVDNYKSEKKMELFPLQAEVYSTVNDELLYTLEGDFGIYYSSRKYLEIRGNVVIESSSYHLRADQLDYYLQRDYLEGRGSVKIDSADFNSKAESFSSDLDLKNLKLFRSQSSRQVRVNFKEFKEDQQKEE